MSLPIDAAQRERALNPSQSFICVAPAGSGKTELLTQRVLVLLTRVQKPEEVLAITFTRKAAAEMLHRVIGALKMAELPKPVEPHKQHTWQLAKAALHADAQYGWQLLQNPHRLHIKTFDGLCAGLVKALPLQSQMGAGVALSDDPERLFELAAKSLLAELEGGDEVADSLAQLLMHLDNRQEALQNLLVELLKTRAAWLPLILGHQDDVRFTLEACLAQLRESHITKLKALIPTELAPKLLALTAFAARNLPADSATPIALCAELTALPDASEQGLAQWRGIAAFLLSGHNLKGTGTAGKAKWRQRFTKNEGVPSKIDDIKPAELKAIKADIKALIDTLSISDDLLDALAEAIDLPYEQYPEQQWQILQALTQLLPRLVAHLQWVFASEGELDFTEMSLRADRALGFIDEPTDLALRLDHRISHVLVDEFQDTSSNQMQLIQKLTAGWQADDGRTLFCVGDAMQSIYAFRSANVGLFLRCLGDDVMGSDSGNSDEHFSIDNGADDLDVGSSEQGQLGAIALETLRLRTNFRSAAGVVDWINSTFHNAFPSQVDFNLGAVPYSEAVAFNPDSENAVRVQGFCGVGDTEPADLAKAEGDWIAAQMQTVLAQNSEATIAILGRGRRQLTAVLPSLKAAGIRYRAVDLDPLAAVPAVQDAWVITRALLNTSDTVAWLSLLRAPWCAVELNTLLQLREQAGESVYMQMRQWLQSEQARLNKPAYQRVLHVANVMAVSLAQRARKPLADWVKGVWLALGGAASLNADAQNNVERFFEALAECDEASLQQNPARLEKLLTELYALPDPEASEQIQVMTMHKSKGLEFDAVFLVGLGSASGQTDSPLMRWHEQLFDNEFLGAEEAATWLLSPMAERGQGKDALYQWLGLQQAKRERLEACRLLYVACTRAKQHLFLTAVLKQKGEGADAVINPPAGGSLLSHIWPAVAQRFSVCCQSVEPLEQTAQECAIPLRRLAEVPCDWVLQAGSDLAFGGLPFVKHSDSGDGAQVFNGNQALPVEYQPINTCVGTLVHEVLEVYIEAALTTLNADSAPAYNWAAFHSAWQARLTMLHGKPLDTESGHNAVAALEQLLDAALAPDSPLIVALQRAKIRHCEYALSGVNSEGVLEACRIDLWWQEEGGQIYLLDYKTGQPQSHQSVAAFEAAQKAQYREVLERYTALLSRHLNAPVTAVLYLVATGSWLVLSDGVD
ncbi:UvrD-helicase domain-containing protein [Marinagarivorans algicola]|uniref:UvrD-helicase domain-containing protein n=1 Tax=Marinagarivorans algicola TaxID=1513270 RepID=UPI0006B9231F|nr:UvrD-helicase domain-containing protein [Marinagarivorans algicola]